MKESDVMLALTFDYGQKAAKREIESAAAICKKQDIPHKVIDLPWYRQFPSALIQEQIPIPDLNPKQLDQLSVTKKTAQAVWVPNRNGVMVNVACSLAEAMVANNVIVGFNKEEGRTFPDNSQEFVKSLNRALDFSTNHNVSVVAPMIEMNKTEIVEWCVSQNVDFTNLWSCYRGDDRMCGQCESCQRSHRALENGGAQSWAQKLFN